MNLRFVLLAAIVLFLAPETHAQSPDDTYGEIYSLIEDADRLLKEGRTGTAAEKYQEAQTGLKELQKKFPTWSPAILKYRLDYVTTKLTQLPPPDGAKPPSKPAGPAQPGVTPAPAADGQVQQLQQSVEWLKRQNALLEAKLREALSVQPAAADPRGLARAEEKIKQLQKEKDLLVVAVEQERENTIKSTSTRATKSKGSDDKVKQLEEQLAAATASAKAAQTSARNAQGDRDDLAKKLEKLDRANKELEQANKELSRRPNRASSRGDSDVEKKLELAQARLAAYEAKAVPLTAEEQAMVKQPPIQVAANVTTSNGATNTAAAKKKYDLPPGAGALFNDAERAIDASRYPEAEKKLRDILRQDENNVLILAKLGAVQLDQGKVSEAEATLKKALVIAPEDPASLYLLGSLKVRQEKFDEALEYLSVSARLDPQKPETQYFLGSALAQKGQRGAAEAALRKAIQLKPAWGEPHYLLAVIYGSQEPTYKELARFHYKKAIAGGASRNLALEKRIEGDSSPTKP